MKIFVDMRGCPHPRNDGNFPLDLNEEGYLLKDGLNHSGENLNFW